MMAIPMMFETAVPTSVSTRIRKNSATLVDGLILRGLISGSMPAEKAFVHLGGLFLLRHSRFISDPAHERQKGKSGSASHVP